MTTWILAAVAIAAVLYDLAVVAAGGLRTGRTISWTLYSLSRDYPAVPFLVGFVAGHIFGTMPTE